jgi:hypothetical protein
MECFENKCFSPFVETKNWFRFIASEPPENKCLKKQNNIWFSVSDALGFVLYKSKKNKSW